MGNQIAATQNQENVNAFVDTITDPWWELVGAEASAASAYSKEIVNATYDRAIAEIRLLESSALSEAQKYQALSKLWGDLSAGIKAEAIGLRGQLTSTQTVWIDNANAALDRAIAVGDLLTSSPS